MQRGMSDMPIKVLYEPLHTLVVHDIVKVQRDDLLRERVTPAGNLPLYWCGGVLFSFASPPMVDDMVKDYMSGKVHWMEVHYLPMKDYQQVLELNDEHYGSTMKVRVIDTSGSPLHNEFVKWLKDSRIL